MKWCFCRVNIEFVCVAMACDGHARFYNISIVRMSNSQCTIHAHAVPWNVTQITMQAIHCTVHVAPKSTNQNEPWARHACAVQPVMAAVTTCRVSCLIMWRAADSCCWIGLAPSASAASLSLIIKKVILPTITLPGCQRDAELIWLCNDFCVFLIRRR